MLETAIDCQALEPDPLWAYQVIPAKLVTTTKLALGASFTDSTLKLTVTSGALRPALASVATTLKGLLPKSSATGVYLRFAKSAAAMTWFKVTGVEPRLSTPFTGRLLTVTVPSALFSASTKPVVNSARVKLATLSSRLVLVSENAGVSFTAVMFTAKVAVEESVPSETLTVKFSVVFALRALMAVALGVKV